MRIAALIIAAMMMRGTFAAYNLNSAAQYKFVDVSQIEVTGNHNAVTNGPIRGEHIARLFEWIGEVRYAMRACGSSVIPIWPTLQIGVIKAGADGYVDGMLGAANMYNELKNASGVTSGSRIFSDTWQLVAHGTWSGSGYAPVTYGSVKSSAWSAVAQGMTYVPGIWATITAPAVNDPIYANKLNEYMTPSVRKDFDSVSSHAVMNSVFIDASFTQSLYWSVTGEKSNTQIVWPYSPTAEDEQLQVGHILDDKTYYYRRDEIFDGVPQYWESTFDTEPADKIAFPADTDGVRVDHVTIVMAVLVFKSGNNGGEYSVYARDMETNSQRSILGGLKGDLLALLDNIPEPSGDTKTRAVIPLFDCAPTVYWHTNAND